MARLEYSRCMICPVRGDCCYFSNVIDDIHHLILDKHPCTYLNIDTGLCTCYEDRKRLFPECLSIEEARKIGSLPVGCLFIKKDDKPKIPFKRSINYESDNIRIQKRYEYLNNLPHETYQKIEKIIES